MSKPDSQKLVNKFVSLTSVDSVSFHEGKMAGILRRELEDLGFTVYEDNAGELCGSESGNLYGYLKGTVSGARPILFSAHMDTVEPGLGKKPVVDNERRMITSSGDTVLGADDVSGMIEILEGIRLAEVPEGVYLLNAAPINLGGADGAPCRAILIERT